MSDELVWQVATVLVSIAGAWGAMRAEVRHLRKDVDAVVNEQDTWRAASVQLATATRDLTHYNNRLDRLESKIDRLLERERKPA